MKLGLTFKMSKAIETSISEQVKSVVCQHKYSLVISIVTSPVSVYQFVRHFIQCYMIHISVLNVKYLSQSPVMTTKKGWEVKRGS